MTIRCDHCTSETDDNGFCTNKECNSKPTGQTGNIPQQSKSEPCQKDETIRDQTTSSQVINLMQQLRQLITSDGEIDLAPSTGQSKAQNKELLDFLAFDKKFSEAMVKMKLSKTPITLPRRTPKINEFCRPQARSCKTVDQTPPIEFIPSSDAVDAQNDEALDLTNRSGTIPFPKLPQVKGYYADFGLTTLSQPREPSLPTEKLNSEHPRDRPVFCVVCEMTITPDAIPQHTNHADTATEDYTNIAGIKFPVVVPIGTLLADELVQCVRCFVVVYHQRMLSHSCSAEFIPSNVLILEDNHHYCLMCQIYFDNREALCNHWKDRHACNEIYFIRKIRGLDTLLPKTTDLSEALNFCCDFCQVFTFKQRRNAVCVKQYQ